jgi:phage/plasmid-associated DNA primase
MSRASTEWKRSSKSPNIRALGAANRTDKLKAELPGVFLWALKGLKRLLKQGHFTECLKCRAFLNKNRTEGDTVRLFATECCQENARCYSYSEPLYELYKYYTEITGRKAVSNSEFGKRMMRLDWKKGRAKRPRRRSVYRSMALTVTGNDYLSRWQQERRRSDVTIVHVIGTS